MGRGQFVIGIIPARGGSKGLPGKNLKLLGGLPLVAHTIRAAKEARTLDRIILSTDSPEIAEVGRQYGVEVPFLRPRELATDDAPIVLVLTHAINWAEKDSGEKVDVVVSLQPTSPLRQGHHIEEGIQILLNTEAESVVGLCEAQHNPYWMWVIQNGEVHRLLDEGSQFVRRQDLPVVYRVNGAFYANRRHVLMEQGRALGKTIRGLIMTEEESVDINSSLDFMLAESVLKSRQAIS